MVAEPNPPVWRSENILRLVSLTMLAAGCVVVLQPFLTSLLMSLVVVSSTWPLFLAIRRRLRGSATAAAAVMTLGLIVVMLVPVVWLAGVGIAQIPELVGAVRAWVEQRDLAAPEALQQLPFLGGWLYERWNELVTNRAQLTSVLQSAFDPAQRIVVDGGIVLGQGVFQIVIAVFVGFFFYRDGEHLLSLLRAGLVRVAGPFGHEVLTIAHGTVQSVILGIVGTAFAQGSVAMIGFWLFGVPMSGLLGLLTGAFSLIPIGPPIIWGGAAIWLFTHGSVGAAIGMALYGMLGISSIDNVVKPLLISRGGRLPFALVLFGVLGGVLAFGVTGVFLGPSLLAVGMALFQHWIHSAQTVDPS
jgi:predicted PurR-regulated permease PerM